MSSIFYSHCYICYENDIRTQDTLILYDAKMYEKKEKHSAYIVCFFDNTQINFMAFE